jgi:hypothetical protein
MRVFKGRFAAGCLLACCAPLPAQEHADLGKVADYPVASEVWLGSLVGEVSVNPEFPVEVNVPGEFRWKAAAGQAVAENEVIGIAGAEKLDLSERDLLLKKNRYRNSVVDLEFANSEKRRSLLNTIRDMEEKLSRMRLTGGERELLGAEFEAKLAKERAELEEELKRSRAKLESDYFELAEAADRKSLDLEIERAEVDHRELERNSEVLAPTTGRIVIEPREAGPIRKETVVGLIVKEGLAEVRLEIADARLRNLPGEELLIEVSGDDGRKYRGAYLRELEQRSMDRNARILVFDVRNADAAEPVPVALGGTRMVMVFRKLAKAARIVPKKDLVFRFPKEIESEGWAVFIEKRWPGVKVTYVAPRDIIVDAANEN